MTKKPISVSSPGRWKETSDEPSFGDPMIRGLGLSQQEFATRCGFSLRSLNESEQGRARPDSSVGARLIVIDRNPETVEGALA